MTKGGRNMAYKHYLKAWGAKLERLSKKDKEELKILYHGLKQLTEDERSFLMEKYIKTDGKPQPDKVMSKQYGLTDYRYTKERTRIEAKLHSIIEPLLKERNDRMLNEIINRSIRHSETMSFTEKAANRRVG